MAKKFFFACVGLMMLAATYNLGTKSAGAAGSMVSPTEVVVRTGILYDGGQIPLPVYADGTQALESECHWTVSIYVIDNPGDRHVFCFTGASAGQAGWEAGWSTPGRYVNCFMSTDPVHNTDHFQGAANYMIVATRGVSAPTGAAQESWGSLKAKYR